MIKFCTADIESNNWIDLIAIGLYDGKNYFVYNSVEKFLDKVIKSYSGHRIYFHNGGRYDFLFLLESLINRGDISFIEKSGGFVSITFRYKNKKIVFADSYLLLKSSLEKLIDAFDIKHKKIKLDFTKKFTYKNKVMQLHLKNDCISLYDILKMFYEKEGKLKFTIASQAMDTFIKDYYDGYVWQCNDKFDGYFRKYYKGGRCEVYKGFGKNLYYYDFNSLYPFVMLQKMPTGSPIKTKKYIKDKIGYYEIKLLQSTNFLISPLIHTNNTGNFYVNGSKNEKYFVMSNDLLILNEEKIKYKVIKGYYFNESDYLFNDYINHYYAIKLNAKNKPEKLIAKYMLNSFYGKFGQKGYATAIEIVNKKNKDGIIYDPVIDLVLVDKKLNVKFKGIHIACYITSLARYYLYQKMKQIGFNNIWYCDTDSIITNKKIKTGFNIGELKLEDNIKEGVFILPKTYGYKKPNNKTVVKFKGFSEKSFSYSELKKLLEGKKKQLVKKQNRMLGFRSSLRRKNKIVSENGMFLKLIEEEKVLSNNYTRRKIFTDKNYIFRTIPFTIKEIESA